MASLEHKVEIIKHTVGLNKSTRKRKTFLRNFISPHSEDLPVCLELETEGYMIKLIDPFDKNAVFFRLSDKGMAFAKDLSK